MVGEDEFTELGGPPWSFLSCPYCAEWSPRTSEYWVQSPVMCILRSPIFYQLFEKMKQTNALTDLLAYYFLVKLSEDSRVN